MTTALPRPFTGEEFLDSLRGGREVWIYGERVRDVTTHPAFRNPARMLARAGGRSGSTANGSGT